MKNNQTYSRGWRKPKLYKMKNSRHTWGGFAGKSKRQSVNRKIYLHVVKYIYIYINIYIYLEGIG